MANNKKKSGWFTKATLRAAMADRPEIMQASGWTYDKDNDLYQGDPNEAGATALRNALAEIGITVTLGTALDLIGAGITSVPAVQRYLANREISGVIKNASKGASTDSAVRGGDVSFQVDASPNFSVSSSDYSITRTPSYSGRVATSQNPAYRTFAEDVEQGARWGYNRGELRAPEYNEYNLVGAKELSNGAEARVYVDPNDNGYVLKQLSGADPVRFKMPYSGFETPEEAVSFGRDYVSVKNSKPYNIVHNVAGYAENGAGKYEPVLRQKMVSVPGGENWLEQKPDVVRFARKIGSPEFPESGMYDVPVNNILLENDLPINDRIDFKPKNLGVLPDGIVMGIDLFKNGGGIHIKPSKKGTFTAAAKKRGLSVQEFASRVLANKGNYSSAMVKKANFAGNASKWHEDGGFLNEYPEGGRIRGRRNGRYFITELNDRKEKKFQDWYADAAATLGLDPNPDAYEQAYDYRGYWLNNRDADVSLPDFHFPDTWKQPHHKTFSDESVYAKGIDNVGHWEGETFVPGSFNNIMQATEPNRKAPETVSVSSEYTPSESILNYIKDTEAFRDKWYQDGNGVWTVGYGFTGDDVRKRYPNGMTKAEADQYFADTVNRRVPMFMQATPNFDKLNQNQRDALFSYYYNIGHGGYTRKSPTMQSALKNMDLDAVVNNIDFGYNDKKNRGLRKRRDYERSLFTKPMSFGGLIDRLKSVYGDNPDDIKAAILRAKNVKK